MPVDVLHRYRRQVSALPHSRAEMGHHQRVSTELIKEVAIDWHAVDAQDVSEHLGEDTFGARRRGAAPILDQHRFSYSPTYARSWNRPPRLSPAPSAHRTVSQKKSDKRCSARSRSPGRTPM